MKWLNGYRIRLVLIGFVAAIVLGGGSAKADFTFGEATCVDEVINSGSNMQECSFLHDGLKLYFSYNLPGGQGSRDIWVSTRAAEDAPWEDPVNLGSNVNGPSAETYPSISPNELEIYFQYGNGPGLMRSTRASKDEPWGPATTYTDLGDALDLDFAPDGLTVYFDSGRSGGYGDWDIWMATRETVDAPWGEPVNLGSNVNDSRGQYCPSISNDGLALFFNNGGLHHISVAIRATKDDTWGPAVLLGPAVNGYDWVHGAEVSPDGSVMYFDSGSSRPGGFAGENFWQVSIIPIIDLNDDGIVDSADMCIMVDHWGTNNSLYDIGPMPWGDGIVDVQDLIVLAEHLFDDPGLVAYWKLDETEGEIAHDTANGCYGTLQGEPTWQSEIGMVDGALELDGIDDCIVTDFVLNPADGEFSVFAWIKGGAPGQVIISQTDGVNWLCTDSLEGNLMTDKGFGRGAAILMSQTVITDGEWHRIGLVWDGSHRTLYVDDVVVAEDTQTNLEGSENGLYIGTGTGTAIEPGSFWSGLIDDVRVYNRAVIP